MSNGRLRNALNILPPISKVTIHLPEDNTRPHIARLCDPVSEMSKIDILDRSSFSPDLSQIKHFWDEFDLLVSTNQRQCVTSSTQRIPHATIRRLKESM